MAGLIEKVEIDLSGLEGIIKAAKGRAMAKKAVSKMARILSPSVKSLAPKRSGALKQSQGVKVGNSTRNKTGAFAVQGARLKVQKTVKLPGRRTPQVVIPAFYDHLVNAGTKPHSLSKGSALGRTRRRRKKPDLVTVDVGQASGKKHPGAKASKFRERAWSANKSTCIAEGMKVMADETQKVIAKESSRLLGKLKGL